MDVLKTRVFVRYWTGSAGALAVSVVLLAVFGVVNARLLGLPRTGPERAIEINLPVPAQLLLAAGDRYLAANFATIRALVTETQYLTSDDFAMLGRIQSDAAWLNPANEDNYYSAAAILPWSGQLEASQYVLRRASDARPFDWQPPFYVAFNYYYFLRDPVEGARWLQRTSRHTDSEIEKISFQQIAAQWAAKAPDPLVAIRLHRELIQSTRHRAFAAFLEKRIARLENLLAITEAQSRFSVANGLPAPSVEALVDTGFLAANPVDPFGMRYGLATDGTAIVVRADARKVQGP